MHLQLATSSTSSASRNDRKSNLVVTPAAIDLADTLIGEAVLLAVAMSMLNARVSGRIIRPGSDLHRYCPQQRLRTAVAEQVEQNANFFFSQALTKHLERLALDMVALAAVWPKSVGIWTSPTIKNDDFWKQVCSQARPVCSSIRILLLVIGDRLVSHHDGFAGRLVEADQLLKSVLNGSAPCVRSDGVIIVPLSDDRRRERRVNIDERVDLLCERGLFRPRLKDVSISGFGLIEAPSIAVGTQIAIRLASARLIVGIVRWSHGGNIGATWLNPLDEGDELFLNAWRAVTER